MADDDDLSPFMEHGADYVAAKGAAGAFNPETYFGPKQDVNAALENAPAKPKDDSNAKIQKIIDDLVSGQEEISKRSRGLLDEERAGTKKMIGSLEEDRQRMLGTPMPERQAMPKAPQQELSEGGMQWMQIATMLGALSGMFVRRGATTALNAFAGAVNGYAKGRQEDFNAKMEEWKAASQQVKEDNQERIDQYNMIMKNEKLSSDMKIAQFKLAAAAWNDEMTYNAADSKRLDVIAQLLEKNEQFQQTYSMNQEKMAQGWERIGIAAQAAAFGRSPEGHVLNQWVEEQKAQGKQPTSDEIKAKLLEIRAQTSGARAQGSRVTQLSAIINEFNSQVNSAITISNRVPRNLQFPPLNKVQEDINRMRSKGTDEANFIADNYTLADLYAKALNPTGVARLDQINDVLAIINRGYNQGTYAGLLRHLKSNMDRAKAGAMKSIDFGNQQQEAPEDVEQPEEKPTIKYDSSGKRLQ